MLETFGLRKPLLSRQLVLLSHKSLWKYDVHKVCAIGFGRVTDEGKHRHVRVFNI